MTTMKIHMYQTRHLFVDDDCVGKLCTKTKTVRIFEAFEHLSAAVLQWLRMHHSFAAKLAVGEEGKAAVAAPPVEFPDEIRELMDPRLGDLTPEAVAYARENWPREEFERRYKGRVEGVGMHDAPPEAEIIDPRGVTVFESNGEAPQEWIGARKYAEKLGDREHAEKLLAHLDGVELVEDVSGPFWTAAWGALRVESRESFTDAAAELLESLEYAAATKKPEEPADGIDLSAPVVEVPAEQPAPVMVHEKPAPKKRGRPKKEEDRTVPTAPAGPLNQLEEANEAELGE
jgi:hypothetical protein